MDGQISRHGLEIWRHEHASVHYEITEDGQRWTFVVGESAQTFSVDEMKSLIGAMVRIMLAVLAEAATVLGGE